MNKSFFLFYMAFCVSLYAKSQSSITNLILLKEASKHIGETVTLCGKVYQASLLSNVVNKPTLMNMGGSTPNERVEVRINFEDRANFSFNPEVLFLHKNICFTGTISNKHGYTEIVVTKENALKLFS